MNSDMLLRFSLLIFLQHWSFWLSTESGERFRNYAIAHGQLAKSDRLESMGRKIMTPSHTLRTAATAMAVVSQDERYYVALGFCFFGLLANFALWTGYAGSQPMRWRRWAPWIWVYANILEAAYMLLLSNG